MLLTMNVSHCCKSCYKHGENVGLMLDEHTAEKPEGQGWHVSKEVSIDSERGLKGVVAPLLKTGEECLLDKNYIGYRI